MEIISNNNGVSAAYIENKRFKSALLTVRFLMPLKDETVTENGMAIKLITENCKKYNTPDKLSLHLSKLCGAKIYVTLSKLGDNQVITVSLKCLWNKYGMDKIPCFTKAVETLKEVLFNPNIQNGEFFQEDVNRIKRFWTDKIKGEINNKRSYALLKCESIMYKNEPYGIPRYGYSEAVKAATGESLYKAYLRIISSAVVRVTFTGEEYPENEVAEITNAFKSGIRATAKNQYINAGKLKEVTERINITQGKLVMGFRLGTAGSDRETYITTVMSDIFGGGTYGKLFTVVREKMGLCYYCSASSNRFKGVMMVDSGIDEANAQKARDAILDQLEEIKKGNFSDETLTSSKLSISNAFKSSADSIETLDFWYGKRILDENPVSPKEFSLLINSVTKEEVIAAAKSVVPDTFLYLLGKEGEK